MSASPWTLDQNIARLSLGPLRATIDLRDPAGGLQEPQLDGTPLHAHLLGVLLARHVDTAPADAYVRGNDLVVTYPQSDGRAMRVQVYWRCELLLPAVAIELQVSVQTDELGIATPVVACSQLPIVEAERLHDAHASFAALSLKPDMLDQLTPQQGPGCLLFHSPALSWCYAEMIHAADFQQDQIGIHASPAGLHRATLEHRLFPGTLEKGVIVRARIRGLFIPEQIAPRTTAADYQQFLLAPLPLTT